MMSRLYAVLMFLCVVSLAACGGEGDSAFQLEARDNGRTLNVEPGDEIEVELVGNPITGFSWSVAQCDEDVLAPSGSPEYIPESNLPGSPGRFRFHFDVLSGGETEVLLVYARPWETSPPLDTFTFHAQSTDRVAIVLSP